MSLKTKNIFIEEFKTFSKENFWICIIFIISLFIVFFTWKWNILEIMLLFFVNLVANVFIMCAIWAYSKNINQVWALYQFFWVLTFLSLAIYGFFYKWQSQYLIWQICYTFWAIKAISFYNFKLNLKYLNSFSLAILNIIFLFVFIYFSKETLHFLWFDFKFNLWIDSLIMAIWFSLGSIWLISVNDKFRYWLNYLWCVWIFLWYLIWSYFSYNAWSLNWLDFWYFLLALTSFMYFSKILPQYLWFKNKLWQ